MTTFAATGVIQYDTITTAGEYSINAVGAQGGDGNGTVGGFGSSVTGDVYLAAGTVLELVVGSMGESSGHGGGGSSGGSGSGGSYLDSNVTSRSHAGT